MFLFIHKAASEVAFWYIYFDCLMQLRGGMNMDGKMKWNSKHETKTASRWWQVTVLMNCLELFIAEIEQKQTILTM